MKCILVVFPGFIGYLLICIMALFRVLGLDGVTCAEITHLAQTNNAICIFSNDNITWLIIFKLIHERDDINWSTFWWLWLQWNILLYVYTLSCRTSSISWNALSWQSGWIAKLYMAKEIASATVLNPAVKNTKHCPNISSLIKPANYTSKFTRISIFAYLSIPYNCEFIKFIFAAKCFRAI